MKMKPCERILYEVIVHPMRVGEYIHPCADLITKGSDISRASFYNALHGLEEKGYIRSVNGCKLFQVMRKDGRYE